MKKLFYLVLAICLLAALWIGLSLLVIGEPMDGEQLYTQCQWDDGRVKFHVATLDSGVSLRDVQPRIEGRTMKFSCRKVLTSFLCSSGEFSADIDVSEIDRIVFGGKTIWERR